MTKAGTATVGKKRDLEASIEAILNGAEKCFIAKGFDGASMSMIARESQVTQSLIHYHFQTKERLWDAVKRRRLNSCFEEQKRLLDQPADEDIITQIITAYFNTLQSNPGLSRLMGWKNLAAPDGAEANTEDQPEAEATKLAINRIQEAQHKGLINADLNPSLVVVSMFGLVTNWFNNQQHYFERSDLDIDPNGANQAYLKTVIQIMLNGILAPS